MKKIQLTKDFYEKFTEALRSGDYIQTSSQLWTREEEDNFDCGHCCLGVAFDLLAPENECDWKGSDLPSDIDGECLDKIHYPQGLIDNEAVLAELNDGFSSDKSMMLRSRSWNLIADDDNELIMCYSFNQIADFIDLNVEIIEE